MDRETELINAVAELTKIIAGMQKSIQSLTEAGWMLKERIEKLEATPHPR